MAKHSHQSWKQDHPSTLFSNSVEKADRSVKQAMSHPEEIAMEHAFNSLARAENAHQNALDHGEHLDMVEQNKAHLDTLRQQLNEVEEIVEDR
ncbi:hypothetical protein JOD29_003873 [Lysinibacillus composti]|uniref:DUF2564 family protein n=1 Tax=Lysinibacillus composti TaxID=720633 RepID=A0A3N9UI32_9BACI|nr:hypothetical protein [Lysinibacillus composti]MBM7610581.1 hypothetical protein [Lysinibacillus composti]RQW71552.1 hypothetical protein EBB45_19070 [Lysinibacillus composti]